VNSSRKNKLEGCKEQYNIVLNSGNFLYCICYVKAVHNMDTRVLMIRIN